ncbi:MAG: hypothetical protein AB1411_06715 [Nitrospirota bacterium]
MSPRIAVILLLAGLLCGCAASFRDEALVRDAMREREAAYAELTQAMTTYCSARHASFEARQACEIDKRLEFSRFNPVERKAEEPLPTASGLRGNGALPFVRCEHAGGRVTCQRLFAASPGDLH